MTVCGINEVENNSGSKKGRNTGDGVRILHTVPG